MCSITHRSDLVLFALTIARSKADYEGEKNHDLEIS